LAEQRPLRRRRPALAVSAHLEGAMSAKAPLAPAAPAFRLVSALSLRSASHPGVGSAPGE
jgi:hypothetical protein